MITTTSPSLSSGEFDVTFGECEKVKQAHVYLEGVNKDDYVFEATTSLATNVVTVTIKKQQISATNTWGAATTTDVNGKDVVVVADCI